MDALKVGDVIVPQVGRLVLVNYRNVIVSDEGECVVEAIRHFGPGAEDDHFTSGVVVDVRPLLGGNYNPAAAVYTLALSGDFAPEYIHTGLTAIRHLNKTYVG
jgi:hypothetical protein